MNSLLCGCCCALLLVAVANSKAVEVHPVLPSTTSSVVALEQVKPVLKEEKEEKKTEKEEKEEKKTEKEEVKAEAKEETKAPVVTDSPEILSNSTEPAEEKPKETEVSVKGDTGGPVVVTPAPRQTGAPDSGTTVMEKKEAAPEFEDRNEGVEGGDADEPVPEPASEAETVAAPAANPEEGDGVAKEDIEPKEGDSVRTLVEDAKGNIPAPETPKASPHIDFNQSEDSNFISFVLVGSLLVCCIYVLQHNKKKILGLMFEGRSSGSRGRNIRYRRLSQREGEDQFPEEIIY